MNKSQRPTPHIFYWGSIASFMGFTTIQVLCTVIVKFSVSPQQNICATLAAILKETTNKLDNMTKKRNPLIAFLFSILTPGLGQVYNGQHKKAITLFIMYLFFPFLFGLIRGTTQFWGLIILIIVQISIQIYIIVDAITNANKQKEYILKNYNTWYYNFVIGLTIFLSIWFYNIHSVLGTQTFRVPTLSNQPTFQLGDRIVVDLKAYKSKSPDYGDIIAFKKDNGQIYCYRVIGLPNDKLEISHNIPIINNDTCKVRFVKDEKADDYQDLFKISEFEEILPNGHHHKILINEQKYEGTLANIKNIIIPIDTYYLLGDNRDNVRDSREIGTIKKDKILGKVLYCFWSKSKQRINTDFRDK